MRKCSRLLILPIALVILFAIFARRAFLDPPQATNTNTFSAEERVPRSDTPAPTTEVDSNRVSVPPTLMSELNRFITLARPYGLDKPIHAGDVVYFTNSHKTHMMIQTKTHIATFFDYKLNQLLASHDSSNPVTDPQTRTDAMSKWYQATAKWTADEALTETFRILRAVGNGGVSWESTNVEPFTITVKNPQGERVTVTPFYTVKLEAPHKTLRAEFRMGESGPGRLTDWFAWPPIPK